MFQFHGNVQKNKHNCPASVVTKLCKKLRSENIVVTKADKENKLVVLDRKDYIEGLNKLLSDASKFKLYEEELGSQRGRPTTKPPLNIFEKCTNEVNAFVKTIPNLSSHVNTNVSSRQPYLYGLVKMHKSDEIKPLRPVLSASSCYNFSLASFLAKAIKPFCYSKFCIKDTATFINQIEKLRNDLNVRSNLVLVSFDVESLFTNIPLKDTISFLLDKIFIDSTIFTYEDVTFTCCTLETALGLCTMNQYFTFNSKIYVQMDGTAMGSPLGPVLANFYLSYIEDNRIDFESESCPLFYARYVDDIFCIFNCKDKVIVFFEHCNLQVKPLNLTFLKLW